MVRASYDSEFKATIMELLQSGKLIKQVSEDYKLNDSIIPL
jgi:transposase-like protein